MYLFIFFLGIWELFKLGCLFRYIELIFSLNEFGISMNDFSKVFGKKFFYGDICLLLFLEL